MIREKNITDNVLNRINKMQMEGSLKVPTNYSPENALKSAYLKLLETKTGKDTNYQPVLQYCTQESICNSLLEMIVQGLNPMKNQGYFIACGKQLSFMRSYLGTTAITKRLPGVEDVKGYAVYKDDVFETEFDLISGTLRIKNYVPDVKNRNPKDIVGAFALVIGEKDILHMEYMDMNQIKAAWNQGAMKGNSPAHNNFPDQMAIKTVVNRACKMYANTSDDSDLLVNLLNKASVEAETEIKENANKEILDFEDNMIEADYEVTENMQEDESEEEEEPEQINESDKTETGQIALEPEF